MTDLEYDGGCTDSAVEKCPRTYLIFYGEDNASPNNLFKTVAKNIKKDIESGAIHKASYAPSGDKIHKYDKGKDRVLVLSASDGYQMNEGLKANKNIIYIAYIGHGTSMELTLHRGNFKPGMWVGQARIARKWYGANYSTDVDLSDSPLDSIPNLFTQLDTVSDYSPAGYGLLNDTNRLGGGEAISGGFDTNFGLQKKPIRIYQNPDDNYAADLRLMHKQLRGLFQPSKERLPISLQKEYDAIAKSIYLVEKLETANIITDETVIYLYGCNNGTEMSKSSQQQIHPFESLGKVGIASQFAKHFKVSVWGYPESVHFPKIGKKEGTQLPAPEGGGKMQMYNP